MTTPAQPDTGAGAAPDTGSAPQDTTATDQAQTEDTTSGTDAPDLQAEIDKWKALARKHETQSKANKKALDEAAQVKAGEPTLEDLQNRLSEADTARDEAEARIVELAYENAVNRIGSEHGLDVEAALDSDSFRNAVGEELDDDFDDDDLAKAIEKVAKVYAKKPRFAKGGTGPARSGADLPGAPAGLRQISEAELARMTPEQINAALEKGQLNSLL